MLKNKSGFTLMELLGVVLILAILTSIALPQYRRSLERAKAMEGIMTLKSVADAAKRYKAATSEAPTGFNQLDVQFDTNKFCSVNGEFCNAELLNLHQIRINNFKFQFEPDKISACAVVVTTEGSVGNYGVEFLGTAEDKGYCFLFYYHHPTQGRDTMTCKLITTGGKYDWLCEGLGTEEVGTDEWLIDG